MSRLLEISTGRGVQGQGLTVRIRDFDSRKILSRFDLTPDEVFNLIGGGVTVVDDRQAPPAREG